jgi:hypothetical protein
MKMFPFFAKIKSLMEVQLKFGIGQLLFGMGQKDVIAVYGKPDKQYTDEEDNIVFLYNAYKLRLTFYKEEGLKLGYIISSAADTTLFGKKIIGEKTAEVKKALAQNNISKWAPETFDSYENSFNEDNWLILQAEFDEVVKLEIGAIINDNDEFDWKFRQ